MRCYIVTFQVFSAQTREKLRERLKTFSNYCPITKHCWAIVTDKKATEIRDVLAQVLTPTDRLFVVRSGVEAAWRNSFGPKNSAWLKKNL